MKTRTSIIALLAAAALVAAGCGGASDETDGGGAAAAGGDGSKGTLSLVAYSTPQVVYDEIIPDFQATPAGEGVEFKTSFGASGDQSRAVEAGQKADVVTFSTEPDMTRLVDAGLVDADVEGRAERGPRHDLGRLLRRARGQPEEHQDLGRPAQAGHRGAHAEPVQLGRGEVEPARRLRLRVGRRQEPGGRARLRPQAHHRAREGPGQVGPRGAAELHRRQRRRAPLLRVRGDHRQQERREARVRHPGRHDQDQHRHRDDQGRAAERRKTFLDYVLSSPARSASPTGATARSTRRSWRRTRTSSPTRPASSRSTTSAAGRRSTTSSSTSRAARSRRSRRTRECRPPSDHRSPHPATTPGRHGRASSASASRRCG